MSNTTKIYSMNNAFRMILKTEVLYKILNDKSLPRHKISYISREQKYISIFCLLLEHLRNSTMT